MPIGLGYWLVSRYGVSWRLFGMGVVTFIGSQLLHIPFNLLVQSLGWIPTETAVTSNLIILALFGGLSAGVFEESARYLTFRYWARDARSWAKGMMLGAGHGGIEAILTGVILIITVVVLLLVQNGQIIDQIPPETVSQIQEQITTVFDIPPYQAILPAVERLFAIILHLTFSLLVMQVFIRKQRRWLLYSILWHTVANGVAVYTAVTWNVLIAEAALGVIALISIFIILRLKTDVQLPEHPQPA